VSARLERDHTGDRLVEPQPTVRRLPHSLTDKLFKLPVWLVAILGVVLVGVAFGVGYWRGTALNDGRAWTAARAADTPKAYRTFRAAFPNSTYAEHAAKALAQVTDRQEVWATAYREGSVAALTQFVRDNPEHPKSKALAEQTAYMTRTFAHFQRGDAKTGLRLLSDFGVLYPDSPMVDDAALWAGEIQFAQGDFHGARASLLYGLKTYPLSNMADQAAVTLGMTDIEIGQKRAGCNRLKEILHRAVSVDGELIEFVKDVVKQKDC